MKTSAYLITPFAVIAVLATLTLAGCNRDQSAGRDAGGVSFSDGNSITLKAEGYPDATITIEGNLLIDGKPLQLTTLQKQYVMEYRAKLKNIAEQGIAVGKQGAKLGIDAAATALKGVLDAEPEHIGGNIQEQANKVKQEALKICDHLSTLRTAQDELARRVPEFAPYTDIDDKVIADCRH